jgi:hypothetical protein
MCLSRLHCQMILFPLQDYHSSSSFVLPSSIECCNRRFRLVVGSLGRRVSLPHYACQLRIPLRGDNTIYHLTFRALHGLSAHQSCSSRTFDVRALRSEPCILPTTIPTPLLRFRTSNFLWPRHGDVSRASSNNLVAVLALRCSSRPCHYDTAGELRSYVRNVEARGSLGDDRGRLRRRSMKCGRPSSFGPMRIGIICVDG